MKKTIVAAVGLLLFLPGVFFLMRLRQSNKLAAALDDEKKSYGIAAEGPLPCQWTASPPERVIAENKSGAILVSVSNPYDTDCESVLSLRAPGLETSPPKEEQKITIPVKKNGSLSWILLPRKTGTYQIAVSDTMNTKMFGVTVTNTFGLTALQAQIASILGTIFGPMLTVPWWWEKLWKKRQPAQ